MQQDYSSNWKASTQRRKQRKYQANAPYHIVQTFFHSTLSKELRAKHSTRSVGVRAGDKVKILRGSFKGKTGKVDKVDRSKIRVYVSGAEFTKKDGNKVMAPITPSNLMIIELADEKRRFKNKKLKLSEAKKGKEKILPAEKKNKTSGKISGDSSDKESDKESDTVLSMGVPSKGVPSKGVSGNNKIKSKKTGDGIVDDKKDVSGVSGISNKEESQ